MAYLGILDGLFQIDGKDVDLSRLEEGIIIAGDEEYNADDMITDDELLELFNDGAMRSKKDILWNIDHLLGEIGEKSKNDKEHSKAYYTRYTGLMNQFREKVEGTVFPEKLEDWWRYGFEVRETGVTLTLAHVDYFRVYSDDTVSETEDTSFHLLTVKTRFLTVEEYAQAYGVTTTTVRQWIRRGKLHTALKRGGEWRIPELAEASGRGYRYRQYKREEHLMDLPEEYAFFNDYDYVNIEQDRKHPGMYRVTFDKDFDYKKVPEEEWGKYSREMEMEQREREKFELYLISNPYVTPDSILITSRG